MNCIHCFAPYDNTAQYCPQCGKATVYNYKPKTTNNNVLAVWLFFALFCGTRLFYIFMGHVWIPFMMRSSMALEKYEAITRIYKTVGIIFLLAELLLCGIVIGIVKNTSARVAIGLWGLLMLLTYLLDQIHTPG